MPGNEPETLLEFTVVGRIMRVAAIDAATGREVVIQGPVNTPRAELARLAVQKLRYVMNREETQKP